MFSLVWNVARRRREGVVPITIYISRDVYEEIRKLVKEGRYPSVSVFIRASALYMLQQEKLRTGKEENLPI